MKTIWHQRSANLWPRRLDPPLELGSAPIFGMGTLDFFAIGEIYCGKFFFRGDLSWGVFFQGRFFLGRFFPGEIFSGEVFSKGDFFWGGFFQGRFFLGRFLPGRFFPGRFFLLTIAFVPCETYFDFKRISLWRKLHEVWHSDYVAFFTHAVLFINGDDIDFFLDGG